MDLDSYWQENRRFVLSVAGGSLLFLSGWWAIYAWLGSDLRALQARGARLQKDLAEPMYTPADLDRARAENEALRAAVGVLRAAAGFVPREGFALSGSSGASSRYVAVVSQVREDLLQRAGRAGLALPQDLGLPTLAPAKEQEIARTLEALDAIERSLRLAIEAGCERVDAIQIKLDPRLLSGKPIDDLERTLVELRLVGPSPPLVRLLELLQEPRDGSVLLVQRAEFTSARSKRDEVRLELQLLVAHPHGLGAAAEPQEES